MTTVLFVHGLESGPHGHKSRALVDAGFEVVAVQMPSSRRAMLSDPLVVALTPLMLIALTATALAGLWPFLATLALTLVLVAFSPTLLTRRMWRRSFAVQRQALAAHRIDVVIGSSFGGAVALELLARGDWSGPTVLLCPAHRLLAARAHLQAPTLPPTRAHVVVVHGRQDEVVPPEHSRQLTHGTRALLIEVDDDHRLTATATAANFRVWVEAAQQLPSPP